LKFVVILNRSKCTSDWDSRSTSYAY